MSSFHIGRIWMVACCLSSALGVAVAQDAPQRKAGWWKMDSQVTGGRTLSRNLCLDATSDARNNIFRSQPGCSMTAQRITGGYSYKKVCGGETTSGTAVGDFNSAYKISESQGSMHVTTDAHWMGACPVGKRADEMWMTPPK